ncbi:MAG: winged helix-turn-helix domain-containing protein [Carnobacterium sp.]|uniref:ArsR/SmtB family transcription factor n=1 Tax=Carnobacterium sp. TaxID=48221 RepID=UPI003315BABB
MLERYIIKNYTQLKTISDPLRVKIVTMLIEKEMTVTEIGKEIGLEKAKVFYHLKELEKQKMIAIVRKEEVKGNVYKYYRATHNGFRIDKDLLPLSKENAEDVYNSIIMQQLENVKETVSKNRHLISDEMTMSHTIQINCSKKQFSLWKEKYNQLINELDQMESDNDEHIFYINTTAIEIENKVFE